MGLYANCANDVVAGLLDAVCVELLADGVCCPSRAFVLGKRGPLLPIGIEFTPKLSVD